MGVVELPWNPESLFVPNSMIEGTMGTVTSMMIGSLDPNRHTIVTFKENKDINIDFSVERSTKLVSEKVVDHTIGKGICDKSKGGRIEKKFNKINHDQNSRSKSIGNSLVLLQEPMNHLDGIISSHNSR